MLAMALFGCGGNTASGGTLPPDGGAGAGGSSAGAGGSGGGGAATGGSAGSGATAGADAGKKSCGGLAEEGCGADEYCDYSYAGKNWCGGDDSNGLCVKRPQDCLEDCPGVCGCDGKFYCNACTAHAAGTDDTDDTGCMPDAGGAACGGLAGVQCAADEWCDFPDGCGYPDALGVCKKRPEGCTADCPGVCGCDGKFYCNVCSANGLGIDTSNDTSCSPGDAGSGSSCGSDFECQAGLKCCYPCGIPGCQNQCMKADSSGQCPAFP